MITTAPMTNQTSGKAKTRRTTPGFSETVSLTESGSGTVDEVIAALRFWQFGLRPHVGRITNLTTRVGGRFPQRWTIAPTSPAGDAGAVREDDGLHPVAQSEFEEDSGHVRLRRLRADRHRFGDLGVGESLREKGERLVLARGEGVERAALREGRSDALAEPPDERAGRRGVDGRVAPGDGPQRIEQRLGPGVLEEEP